MAHATFFEEDWRKKDLADKFSDAVVAGETCQAVFWPSRKKSISNKIVNFKSANGLGAKKETGLGAKRANDLGLKGQMI